MDERRSLDLSLKEVDKKSDDARKIRKIFLEAFPSEERPPYWLLKNRSGNPCVDFYGVYDRGRLIGFVYTVRHRDLAYLFFLAVDREERGHGYGRRIMEILKEKYKSSRLFLALEELDETAENYEQRQGRHRFYESCGLRDMPYRIREGSVTYAVMGTAEKITPEEYRELMNGYLGFFRHFLKTEMI